MGNWAETDILVDIFLPDLQRTLAHLKAHLCGLVVHEATERRRKSATTGLRLLLSHISTTVGATAVALLRLRRWRPELRDGRNMLGDGVVERR